MTLSIFSLAIAALLAAMFVSIMRELVPDVKPFEFRQVGDTSLGRNSIHWMAALALFAAVAICFGLI